MSGYLIVNEINALTRRLYAEGYTRENHPDTVYWSDFQNLGYKWETMLGFTWETPCGLLIQGESDIGRGLACGDAAYQGVWYCPENNNPLLQCPYEKKDCPFIPAGFPVAECPCRQTEREYDYRQSVEKAEAERRQKQKANKRYMEIEPGCYCSCIVGSNGFQGGRVEVRYDMAKCIGYGCTNHVCLVRKQQRDLSKVNVFYDIRRTWMTKVGFLEDKRVEVTKGVKVFDKSIAKTDAEIWLKVQEAAFNPVHDDSVIQRPRKTQEDRAQEYFTKMHRKWPGYDYFEFHYSIENVRIERREQRDILQDLRDVADGIEVVHEADKINAAKVQARARKEAGQQKNIQKMERMILSIGWDGMDDRKQRRAVKLLGWDRIDELCEMRKEKTPEEKKEEQISLFEKEASV